MPRGGYRPGAGRPKGSAGATSKGKAAERVLATAPASSKRFKTALEFAMSVINDPEAAVDAKIRLAIAAMPYQTPKLADVAPGKKEQRDQAAKEVGVGKFAPPAPPKLVVDNK